MDARPTKVLLIEDNPGDARLIRELLADCSGMAFDVECVPTLARGLERIQQGGMDVVLLDLSLPDSEGMSTFARVHAQAPQLPIIVLTGSEDVTLTEKIAFEGGQDYLVKGHVTGMSLVRSMRYAIERQRAQVELRAAHDELEKRVLERTAELAATNQALQMEIGERQRTEQQIKVSLKEKEVLLREIHHRVKNNLQIISSLLNLQAEYIQDSQALEFFRDSQNRVRSMALVHEKLYQSKELSKIPFDEYIRDLGLILFQMYRDRAKSVRFTMDVETMYLDIETAVPCGLLINELISNCLKHAFPNGRQGEVTVCLRPDQGRFQLAVSDDGIGLPKNMDFRNTKSFGLQLVNTLTEQLGGTIELQNHNGTTFRIRFAEIKYKERE